MEKVIGQATRRLSESGVKLFNLLLAKEDFAADQGQTPINAYLSTTAPNYTGTSSNGFAVLNASTEGLSSISISSTEDFVAEATAGESTTVTFNVSRSGDLTGAATVNWRIKSSSEADFVESTNSADTTTDADTEATDNGRAERQTRRIPQRNSQHRRSQQRKQPVGPLASVQGRGLKNNHNHAQWRHKL